MIHVQERAQFVSICPFLATHGGPWCPKLWVCWHSFGLGDDLHRACTAYHVEMNYGEKVIARFLGYSMLTYCPHSEAEMTAAGTLPPFDWV